MLNGWNCDFSIGNRNNKWSVNPLILLTATSIGAARNRGLQTPSLLIHC